MSHHELLDALDVQIVTAPPFALGGYTRFLQSLRAILELHRPEAQEHGQYEKCWNCNLLYPCPTIQVFEKELT